VHVGSIVLYNPETKILSPHIISLILIRLLTLQQDYCIGTAQKMSVDIDGTPDLLLLIQQKLR